MSVKFSIVKDILVCFTVVLISLGVGQFYLEGDQGKYILAYEAIENSDLSSGFLVYKAYIATEEPLHYIISWIFSSFLGMNKLFAMSLLNGYLAFLFIKLVKKIGGSAFVAYVFVLTNYYFLVLYLTAERLKIAFIFLLLALLFLRRPKASYLLFLLAVLSHFQMLIIFLAREFERLAVMIVRVFQRLSISKSYAIYLIVLALAIGAFFYLFGGYLLWKVPQYMKAFELGSVWQTTLFMLMTLAYTRNRKQVILFFIPIISASLVVGPERVVIMSFFLFTYYAFQYRHGLNYGIVITSIYFGLKSIGFLVNIFDTGQGF